jgi:hypothetical protein
VVRIPDFMTGTVYHAARTSHFEELTSSKISSKLHRRVAFMSIFGPSTFPNRAVPSEVKWAFLKDFHAICSNRTFRTDGIWVGFEEALKKRLEVWECGTCLLNATIRKCTDKIV